MSFFVSPRALRRAGVLGINRRNLDFITRYNARKNYKRVDDKLLTKALCNEAGIPVPELYGKAETVFEIKSMMAASRRRGGFVLKPARGAMGNGILVMRSFDAGEFKRAGGTTMSDGEVAYHAAGILAGLYSLGGRPDKALIEEVLAPHPAFSTISTDGVPDVRVIVFRGVPVMSMTRLPTRESGGRANLHQGAVGAGIDIATGKTTHAVWHNRPISRHPDSDEDLLGRDVPAFEEAVEIATRCSDMSGLGYVGADIVVDARKGPVVLELNARPGLSIQIANDAGLLPRLLAIEEEAPEALSITERVALGQRIAAQEASS